MKLLQAISIAFALLLACSCGSSNIPQNLDSFVDKVELDCENYEPNDWQRSLLQYEQLIEEFSSSGREYSEAEKQMAARAMGRYHSLLIKYGVEQSAAYLKELEAILPSYLEGLVEGLGENSEELEKSFEGLFSSEEMEKAFEGMGNKLEEIFGGLDGQ